MSEYRIFGQWEKAVGTVIARHAQPQEVRSKKLTLIVDSPAWMQQLSMLKPVLVEKINSRLGTDGIKGITLKLGEVRSTTMTVEDDPAPVSLDEDDRRKIEQYVHEVGDPDTRGKIRRLIEKDFLNKKKRQQK